MTARGFLNAIRAANNTGPIETSRPEADRQKCTPSSRFWDASPLLLSRLGLPSSASCQWHNDVRHAMPCYGGWLSYPPRAARRHWQPRALLVHLRLSVTPTTHWHPLSFSPLGNATSTTVPLGIAGDTVPPAHTQLTKSASDENSYCSCSCSCCSCSSSQLQIQVQVQVQLYVFAYRKWCRHCSRSLLNFVPLLSSTSLPPHLQLAMNQPRHHRDACLSWAPAFSHTSTWQSCRSMLHVMREKKVALLPVLVVS
jgi:hypothetical protein